MTKVVFMGTPDFSVPTLTKLYNDNDIEISYVVTKEDSKSSRGQKIEFSDIKKKALELNLPILQPNKIKDDRAVIDKIKEAKPDFLIVVAYGQILSKEILDIPTFAPINGHASLLPKYRGASPIQSAVLNGDDYTGVTTMYMDVGMDTGDILLQEKVDIDKKETSDSLFNKLSVVTADLILRTIKDFGNIKRVKQDETQVSKSVIIKKEDGLIDFKNENAVLIDRKVRGYNSWPSAFIKNGDDILKIWDVDIVDVNVKKVLDEKISSGDSICRYMENVYIIDKNIYGKCKDGYVRINVIQKSGKNKMNAKDFINGIKM